MAKVGLSFSRCVRDIVDGVVDIEDVLVIVARTQFDPTNQDQWRSIWEGYGAGSTGARGIWSNPEWVQYSDQDEVRVLAVVLDLWNSGKIHQPRNFGAHPRRLPYYWLETIVSPEEMTQNPTVIRAWEQFQIVAGLISPKWNIKHKE